MPIPTVFLNNIQKMIVTCLLGFTALALASPFAAAAQPEILPAPQKDRLSAMPKVIVRQVNLEGNTVFPDAELSEILAPYENREITSVPLAYRYGKRGIS